MFKDHAEKEHLPVNSSDVEYPTWKSIINIVGLQIADPSTSDMEVLRDISSRIDKVTQAVKSLPAVVSIGQLLDYSAFYEAQDKIDPQVKNLKSGIIGNNEFITVYDVFNAEYKFIDENIERALGFSQPTLSIPALLGVTGQKSIIFEEDVPHFARWAAIAYLVLSLPGLKFRSLDYHYKINFRLNTHLCDRDDLKEAGQVMIEKSCFPIHIDRNKSIEPNFHIDRWMVLDKNSFDYVRPTFVSDFRQSEKMIMLSYLLNAEIIGVPTKYLLILDERRQFDRNKSVANSMNHYLRELAKIETNYNENQISDFLAKSIRNKVDESAKIWSAKPLNTFINSDNDAIEYARRMGLLPIPNAVKALLYENVWVKK